MALNQTHSEDKNQVRHFSASANVFAAPILKFSRTLATSLAHIRKTKENVYGLRKYFHINLIIIVLVVQYLVRVPFTQSYSFTKRN